jgi:T-complex protein 1 subunit beta
VIKKPGGSLSDSFLEEGFVLDKSFGIGQPRRVENAKILIANTPMDTDKIKIYGSRVSANTCVLSLQTIIETKMLSVAFTFA